MNRDFTAAAPNRLWIVDFTYVATWSGMAFTAFVSDVFSRRIVGWRTACSMPTELPWTPWRWRCGPEPAPVTATTAVSSAGSLIIRMPAVNTLRFATPNGSPMLALWPRSGPSPSYDNAMAESIIGLCKTECVRHDGPFRGVDDLELATLSWVHWFNTNRLHSALDYVTPIEHEDAHYRQINTRRQPLPGELALH